MCPLESMSASSCVVVRKLSYSTTSVEKFGRYAHLIHALQVSESPEPCIALYPVRKVHELLRRVHKIDDVLWRALVTRIVEVLGFFVKILPFGSVNAVPDTPIQ